MLVDYYNLTAKCRMCGEDYDLARAKLGYSVCLDCGDKIARAQTTLKAKQVAQHYNKGGYMYLTPNMDLMSLNRKI